MKPIRYRYKACHERRDGSVWVRITTYRRVAGVESVYREKTNHLPRETPSKDIHRYKQVMCEIERQKDLDKV